MLWTTYLLLRVKLKGTWQVTHLCFVGTQYGRINNMAVQNKIFLTRMLEDAKIKCDL